MLSETAPSAFARDFNNALRRAAWTGGVGTWVAGSVSLSYSIFADEIAVPARIEFLVTADWSGTRGWSSAGALVEVEENREPPSVFLPEERDLSRSWVC